VDDRVLIAVSEAARRLGTYPNAINRWIAKGELEAFRVEGRGFRFVDEEQVETLGITLRGLAEQTQDVEDPGESVPPDTIGCLIRHARS
jgi:excisionase family DNA binding protein